MSQRQGTRTYVGLPQPDPLLPRTLPSCHHPSLCGGGCMLGCCVHVYLPSSELL